MDVASPATTDDPDPPSQLTSGFMWKSLFASKSSQVTPSSSPSFLDDGTPVVLAPPSVILKATEAWAGHILCHFLGVPPSPSKIFADLNPVWGRKGAITVRRFSEGTCLVYVPSASHRRWILDAGLWSSGNVAFTVSEWTSSSSLVSAKLTSAPTMLTLRDVPPQLWSQRGVETIAGGVAKLIPNSRASLPLSSLGTAKIRAIVPLGPVLPSTVIVQDTHGDSVRVAIEYGRLPVLCSSCNTFGHSPLRCPVTRSKTSEHVASASSEQPPQVSSVQVQEEGGAPLFGENPNISLGPHKPTNTFDTLQTSKPIVNCSDPSTMGHNILSPQSGPLQSLGSTLKPGLLGSSSAIVTEASKINTAAQINSRPSSPRPDDNDWSVPVGSVPADLNHVNPNPTDPTDIPAPSLTSQILSEITAALASPRPSVPANTHIYFSTPSTSTIPPATDDSPPSIANFPPHTQQTAASKTKGAKKNNLPVQFNIDDDISQLLNSPEWQRGYRPSVQKDGIRKGEAT